MIKCVAFDFDGTLVDSTDVFVSLFNQFAERYKIKKIGHDDFRSFKSLSITDRLKQLNFPIYKLHLMAMEFNRLYKDVIQQLILFDGIKELLDELNWSGYRLAVISSNSEHNIKEFLENNQIDYVKDYFCSNDLFGKDKNIKKLMKLFSLARSELIYVGDEQRDIIACKKAGIKVIWVGWGYETLEVAKRENPDFIVNKPNEILEILQKEKFLKERTLY